ncbi:MAG: M23 family metallopeptidase [Deltaproteobacteria bacterium]|nr:M23 family metallopeptidase [Deltaproteobacteria bacterium]
MHLGGILFFGLLATVSACAGLAPSSLPRERPAAPPPGTVVVVAAGDTLTRIAAEHGVPVDEIVEVNGLASADAIVVGQRLFLPAGVAPPLPEVMTADDDGVSEGDPSGRGEAAPAATLEHPPASVEGEPASTAPLVWPVEGVVLRDFALAQPATGRRPARAAYEGLLIAAPPGTTVRAADAGVVTFAGSQGTAYGLFVVVEHAGALVTVYAHLRRVAVSEGQTVAAGEVVGEIGATGLVGASPRVQFQVRRDRVPVDPLPLLPP